MRYIFILFFLFHSLFFLKSQNDSCLNIGFENGQFNGWQAFLGDASGTSNQLINLSPDTANLFHSIQTVGFDTIISSLPRVSSLGGGYSAMIGDGPITGMRGGLLKQSFIVNASTPYFVYHCAIVLENAAHIENESPYFTAKVFDVNSTEIYSYGINAANITSGMDPDFIMHGNYFYKQWETTVVDLTAYIGQEVTVEFSAADCFQGGHSGYAYVDADCFAATNCSLLDIDFVNVSNVDCLGTGNIGAQVSFGTSPYTYLWTTGASSTSIQPDSTGIYGLTVTDAYGCAKSKSILINGSEYPTGVDLEANMIASVLRPGQTTRIDINSMNNGCIPASGILKMVFDSSLLTLHSIIPTPAYIDGDTVVWNSSIMSYDSLHFSPNLYVVVDTSATVGMTACFELIFQPLTNDADSSNNVKNYCFPIVNSYDPNYKQVYPKGECTPFYVLNNQELTYTVHFQNTGTAPAINIHIMDTLASGLDINSVKVVAQSHDSLITEVIASNILNFRFDDIQLLHSGANEVASHGYVIFKISPTSGIPDYSSVNNRVGIYFDYNPAIITNTVLNTFVTTIPHEQTILNESVVGSFTLNSVVYDSTGIYSQQLYTSDGCDSTVILNLTILPTGIENQNVANLFIVPNPSNGEFNFVLNNNNQVYSLEIMDITGKVVYSENSNKNKLAINLNGISSGIYFARIISASFNANAKLIIK